MYRYRLSSTGTMSMYTMYESLGFRPCSRTFTVGNIRLKRIGNNTSTPETHRKHTPEAHPVVSPRGGGQTGQLAPPPPNLRSDTPSDRSRSEEIFMSEKNGGRFTGFVPTFYMHRRYGERSLVLRLRKKRELKKLLKELL